MRLMTIAGLSITIFVVGASLNSCSDSDDGGDTALALDSQTLNQSLERVFQSLDIDSQPQKETYRRCVHSRNNPSADSDNTGSESEERRSEESRAEESRSSEGRDAENAESEENSSASESASESASAEELERILRIVTRCRGVNREELKDYDRYFLFNPNSSECKDSELWARIYALRITDGEISSAQAEQLAARALECLDYRALSRRIVILTYPWFSWDCISESRFYAELEKSLVRNFARYVMEDPEEYVPSTRWEISLAERDEAVINCVNEERFDDPPLAVDRACLRMRLGQRPLRDIRPEGETGTGTEDDFQLNDYLGRATLELPQCFIRRDSRDSNG